MDFIELYLPSGATAFSTMRGSGCPGTPYSGFSTCDYTGDEADHVAHCRAELARFLDIPLRNLIIPRQTHSSEVAVIRNPANIPSLEGVDALVTDVPRLALCIHTADCVPGVLYDPVAHVIGAFHSGWKGTVARIAARTVEAMVSAGADPERIHAALGPSICMNCFEVGEEVAAQFSDVNRLTGGKVISRRYGERPHVDLREAVSYALISSGVRSENIIRSGLCSYCDHHRFFSARRLGTASGRTLTCIMLR